MGKSYNRLGIKIQGHCSICQTPLVLTFPDDFPEEYKFCCLCRYIAKEIVHGCCAETYLNGDRRAFKILERITLVEGK